MENIGNMPLQMESVNGASQASQCAISTLIWLTCWIRSIYWFPCFIPRLNLVPMAGAATRTAAALRHGLFFRPNGWWPGYEWTFPAMMGNPGS